MGASPAPPTASWSPTWFPRPPWVVPWRRSVTATSCVSTWRHARCLSSCRRRRSPPGWAAGSRRSPATGPVPSPNTRRAWHQPARVRSPARRPSGPRNRCAPHHVPHWEPVADIRPAMAVGVRSKLLRRGQPRSRQHPPMYLVLRRRFDLVEGGAPALDLLDDVGGGRVPDEGLGILVPMLNPFLDGCDQLRNAGEDAAA